MDLLWMLAIPLGALVGCGIILIAVILTDDPVHYVQGVWLGTLASTIVGIMIGTNITLRHIRGDSVE